eukprot:g1710.t1 g1710   contig10:2637412-2639558(+)
MAAPKKRARSVRATLIDHTYYNYSDVTVEDVEKELDARDREQEGRAGLVATRGGSNSNQGERLQQPTRRGRRAKAKKFPTKLHEIVSNADYRYIIRWMPHGRSWTILDKKRLLEVLGKHFAHESFESFNRSVNGWGFKRLLQEGPDHKSWYHELFLRGKPELTILMERLVNPGKRIPDKQGEPNFYNIAKDYPLPPDPPLVAAAQIEYTSGIATNAVASYDPSNNVTHSNPKIQIQPHPDPSDHDSTAHRHQQHHPSSSYGNPHHRHHSYLSMYPYHTSHSLPHPYPYPSQYYLGGSHPQPYHLPSYSISCLHYAPHYSARVVPAMGKDDQTYHHSFPREAEDSKCQHSHRTSSSISILGSKPRAPCSFEAENCRSSSFTTLPDTAQSATRHEAGSLWTTNDVDVYVKEDGSRKRESTHGAEGFEDEEDDEDKESHEQLLKRRNRSLLSSNGAPLIWTGANNSVSDTANVAASRNTVSGAGDSGVRVDEGCDSLNNDLLDPSLDSYLDEFLDN